MQGPSIDQLIAASSSKGELNKETLQKEWMSLADEIRKQEEAGKTGNDSASAVPFTVTGDANCAALEMLHKLVVPLERQSICLFRLCLQSLELAVAGLARLHQLLQPQGRGPARRPGDDVKVHEACGVCVI